MIKIEGKGGISAKIIADSVSEHDGSRITTFELEYHRYVHAEFMTHRLFSRNAASSRAIPVDKALARINTQPATPTHWGKNQPGMQANEENNEPVTLTIDVKGKPTAVNMGKEDAWQHAARSACSMARVFNAAGYHKQIVNRLTEPFQMIKVVCTATEYDNFFALRLHKDAQPEIQELARCMWEAREKSEPMSLQSGEWHLPYVERYIDKSSQSRHYYILDEKGKEIDLSLGVALAVSASCCAQVSYRALDMSIEKAERIFKMLIESRPSHASPVEHQATPILNPRVDAEYVDKGTTHFDLTGHAWSGNFKGWVQHRQLIQDHTVWEYDHKPE